MTENVQNALYYLSYVLGVAAAVASGIKTGKHSGVSKKDAVTYTVAAFFSAVAGAFAMAQIYNAVLRFAVTSAFPGVSSVSLYGGLVFMPPVLAIICKAGGIKFSQAIDMGTPGVYFLLTITKCGCFISGCCHGFICDFGLYNRFAHARTFPVQLVEALFTLVLALASLRLHNRNALPRGALYPLFLAFYGVGRFCAEFLRYHEYEEELALFYGLSFWQAVSLVCVITGFAISAFIIVKDKKTRATPGQ